MSTSLIKLDLFASEGEKAFAAENDRRDKLTEKAEKMMTAVGVIMGFQLVDLQSLSFSGGWQNYGLVLSLAALTTLSVALVLALLGMRVLTYTSHPLREDLVNAIEGADVTDEKAKSRVANTYFAAREHNALINDARARLLAVGGYCLIAGFFLAVASRIVIKVVK